MNEFNFGGILKSQNPGLGIMEAACFAEKIDNNTVCHHCSALLNFSLKQRPHS